MFGFEPEEDVHPPRVFTRDLRRWNGLPAEPVPYGGWDEHAITLIFTRDSFAFGFERFRDSNIHWGNGGLLNGRRIKVRREYSLHFGPLILSWSRDYTTPYQEEKDA